MTGLSRTSADLSPRRRRILYRCWHRGIREMDLVFGQFAESESGGLSDDDVHEFEAILAEDADELNAWMTGATPLQAALHTPLLARVACSRPDFDPLTPAQLTKSPG